MRNRWLLGCATLNFLLLSACEFESVPLQNPNIDLADGGLLDIIRRTYGDAGVAIVKAQLDNPLASGFPAGLAPGAGYGAPCDQGTPCRGGLSCAQATCDAVADGELGDFCVTSRECAGGQCVTNQCVAAGEAALGEPCASSAACAAGLRCGVVGYSTQCLADGKTDLGGACASSNECLSGLACYQEDSTKPATCRAVPGAPAAVPALWTGVQCDEGFKENVRAYFEVPGAPDAQEGDYFRLPFPNDILTDGGGRVNLAGFPTPGVNPIVGIDPVQPYVEALNGTVGWGADATVTFRFSGEIDFDSFKDSGEIYWVDITDPTEPANEGLSYLYSPGRSKYVCHSSFSARRPAGSPMEPGHTYAVWLGAAGRGKDGLPIVQAENFVALLADTLPNQPQLAAAHEKYAPFRAYLAAIGRAPADVLVASVFTVSPVRDPMTKLATAVRATPTPTSGSWTKCGAQASPCPQAEGSRGCSASGAFDEYHTLIELPIFQQGQAPYLTEGGKITSGSPVRTEQVCASLTVPRGAVMPAEGWPAVVFTHGTGGSFRSHVNSGLAEAYAAVPTPTGMVHFAVLGFDQVQHGPRRGDSDESPDNLFFNFLNPDAAQGNPLQGAADVISVGRFIASLTTGGSATKANGAAVDPARIVYFGHSQGAMHGSLGLPFAGEYQAAVLSGNGASLIQAMLTKTEPVDISSAVPLVINDGVKVDIEKQEVSGSLPGGSYHPVLALMQQHIDPADPLNFARQISREPLGGQTAKHVFQTYGQGDHFSPPLTMEIYARAANLSVVRAHSSAVEPDALGEETQEFPLSASFAIGGQQYTAGVRQYGPPEGQDGHFVVFDVADAAADAARFLGMAANGVTPQIGE